MAVSDRVIYAHIQQDTDNVTRRLCNCLSSHEYNHVVKFRLTSSLSETTYKPPMMGIRVLTRGRAPILHFRRCARFIPLRSTEAESQLSSHHHVEFENRLTSSSITYDSANLVLWSYESSLLSYARNFLLRYTSF